MLDFAAVSGAVPELLRCGVKQEVGEDLTARTHTHAHTTPHETRPRWVVLRLISKRKDTRHLNKDSLQGIFGKHGGGKTRAFQLLQCGLLEEKPLGLTLWRMNGEAVTGVKDPPASLRSARLLAPSGHAAQRSSYRSSC